MSRVDQEYAEKVWKIARPAANLKLKKEIQTCSFKETNDILTISKLRNNVSKDNSGCICQFFFHRLAKILQFFSNT